MNGHDCKWQFVKIKQNIKDAKMYYGITVILYYIYIWYRIYAYCDIVVYLPC